MDETTTFLALADRMLWVAVLAGAPVLIAALAVGLVVGFMVIAILLPIFKMSHAIH